MTAVLGIDAAWTAKEPSGVALIADDAAGRRLIAIAPSYESFTALPRSASPAAGRPRGTAPVALTILEAAHRLIGNDVELVAVDMPLSLLPITGRRASDDAVNASYSGRWCSTHTASVERPGKISDSFRADFDAAGYPLRLAAPVGRGLIEVYPHPALVELARSERRLPYKWARAGKYWPEATPQSRKSRLLEIWREVVAMLDAEIAGVADALTVPAAGARGWEMKSFEDQLDAIVCAWVGAEALAGRARHFGDQFSAIWIPSPR